VVRIFSRIPIDVRKKTGDRTLRSLVPDTKPFIRLFCQVTFSHTSLPEDAIIDTGAHVSLIPYEIWSESKVEIIGEYIMQGAVPGSGLPVKVGYIEASLGAQQRQSQNLRFLAFLAYTSKVPLLLGIRDVLEKFDVHLEFSRNLAYLEQ
tara:strand:- start:2813 stop:3259 length:447 start_codon:yes stop_codon:yes gene_type:complete